MTETTTTVEDLEIPDNVFVSCPRNAAWDNVRVANACTRCEHFAGLYGVRLSGNAGVVDDMPFARKFRVYCSHPAPLEVFEVKL